MAYALFVTAVVFAVAAIANNNLQDLKTGQLVDATPSKQQWALVIGVDRGRARDPAGARSGQPGLRLRRCPGSPGAHALPAPQAGLISALAQGVIQNNIDWRLIGIGACIGVGVIVVDAILRARESADAPAAAGGGPRHLPADASTLMVVVGAMVGWWFDRRADRAAKPEATKQLGVLLASGLIVGESGCSAWCSPRWWLSRARPSRSAVVGDAFDNGRLSGSAALAFALVIVCWVYRCVARAPRGADARHAARGATSR